METRDIDTSRETTAANAADTPAVNARITLKLSRPIMAHGKPELRELDLEAKPLTVRAFTQFGMPYREYSSGPRDNRETRFEFVFPAVLGFASMATGIDEVALSAIAVNDMLPLALKVMELVNRSPNG